MIDNCKITPVQICSTERLQYSNRISYIQVYRTLQAILLEIDSNKADCFAKFPAFIKQYKAVDNRNAIAIVIGEGSYFEAIFFAPASTQRAYTKLCKFIALDRTYTRSKYCIMLLIVYSIDTNNNVLLLV
jgi:hypothetical protein